MYVHIKFYKKLNCGIKILIKYITKIKFYTNK